MGVDMKDIFLFVVTLGVVMSIASCQCKLRAGDGISSHYNPLLGCVFEKN